MNTTLPIFVGAQCSGHRTVNNNSPLIANMERFVVSRQVILVVTSVLQSLYGAFVIRDYREIHISTVPESWDVSSSLETLTQVLPDPWLYQSKETQNEPNWNNTSEYIKQKDRQSSNRRNKSKRRFILRSWHKITLQKKLY